MPTQAMFVLVIKRVGGLATHAGELGDARRPGFRVVQYLVGLVGRLSDPDPTVLCL